MLKVSKFTKLPRYSRRDFLSTYRLKFEHGQLGKCQKHAICRQGKKCKKHGGFPTEVSDSENGVAYLLSYTVSVEKLWKNTRIIHDERLLFVK